MDSSQRGVRFQGYADDVDNDGDGDISRNRTPVPRTAASSSSHPPVSPRVRPTIPTSKQPQPQPLPAGRSSGQAFFPVEVPIDYNVPSIVEEGGFPFETPSPNVDANNPYVWTPVSPATGGPAYYPNGQYYQAYDQDASQQMHMQDAERSPTDRNLPWTRPGLTRLPSSTYFPIRHPETGGHDQYAPAGQAVPPPFIRRGTSRGTLSRGRPRYPRTAWSQKMASDPDDDYLLQPSSVASYRRDPEIESEDGSANDDYGDYDEFDIDQDGLAAGGLDLTPSTEDMQNPEYKERVEWQNRLVQVLSGDVVTSEKKRIAEPTGPEDEKARRYELWLGIRAKAYGRSLADQRRFLVEGRVYADRVIDEVLAFSVKTFEDGAPNAKTAEEQVDEILERWDRCESLYSSRAALMEDKPATDEGSEFDTTLTALIAWSNVTKNVRVFVGILRAWTGQDDLDLTRKGGPPNNHKDAINITDESSFIERILKENQIEQTFEKAILSKLSNEVNTAKETMEAYHLIFDRLKLRSFLGNVQLLVNFPTKLIEEALKIRLAYAKKLRDPELIVMEQLLEDFALCMKVAVGIRKEYLQVTEATEGWNLVSWVDDSVRSSVNIV
jgi:mitogen-activated protein kinase kinase kinase